MGTAAVLWANGCASSGETESPRAAPTTIESARAVPPLPPLPALAFLLELSIPLPKSMGCDPAKARLTVTEVSSAWGPSRDPAASPGRHSLRASFVSSGDGCCPPTVHVFTSGGQPLEKLDIAAWDVPPGVICQGQGPASALVGFGSPVGTRALRIVVPIDGTTEMAADLDLESGDVARDAGGGRR